MVPINAPSIVDYLAGGTDIAIVFAPTTMHQCCLLARQRAQELVNTPEFVTSQRQRKKVEALFAELKNQIGLPRLASAETQVCARAVLPGSGSSEPQATGALPQLA